MPLRASIRSRARGCLLVAAAALLAGEVGARLWDLLRGQRTGSLYDYVVGVPTGSAGSRFKLRPGAEVVVPERYGDVRYRFNRAGYRDHDHPPPGVGRRVVVLGDSVTFGLGVAQDRIWAARLEERLRQRLGRDVEVVNLAVFAYDTADELATLAEDGLAHRPRLVLLQFYMNDFSIEPPGPRPAAPPPGLADHLRAAYHQWAFRSALYRRLHQARTGLAYLLVHDLRRRRFPETLNAAEPRHKLAYLAAQPDDGAVPAFAALAEIDALARRHGAALAVLLTPDETQLHDDRWDGINARMARFCAGRGIPLVDALPALRRAPDRVGLFNDGVHLSPAGHEIVARLVDAELAQRGLP